MSTVTAENQNLIITVQPSYLDVHCYYSAGRYDYDMNCSTRADTVYFFSSFNFQVFQRLNKEKELAQYHKILYLVSKKLQHISHVEQTTLSFLSRTHELAKVFIVLKWSKYSYLINCINR